MISYLRFIKTVLLHKWYMILAGRRLKVPFWRHHYSHNDHHWEFYVSRDPDQRGIPTAGTLSMPIVCVREMIADWFAAGKTYNGAWPNPANFTWYQQNRRRMQLHHDTEMRIGLILAEAAQQEWK